MCYGGLFQSLFPPSYKGTHSQQQEKDARKWSYMIDRKLSSDNSSRSRELKILLLGTGESGKSTIIKQMKIIHQNGYKKSELLSFRKDIYRNVVESMQQMITAMHKMSADFSTEPEREASKLVLRQQIIDHSASSSSPLSASASSSHSLHDLDKNVAEAICFLWRKSGIRDMYDKLSQISYILCQAPYFLDNIERISSPDYTPTIQDVLRARIKTTGISETRFRMGSSSPICMIDVGGQISERKKWIHCFDSVSAIVFCVALSEYDQVLLEDPNQSRMLDSFLLFQSVINSHWFRSTVIILFLNKIDLFKKKIKTSPLSQYFEDYQGPPDDYQEAATFLQKKFLALNHAHLPIYTHWTCATDTRQIETVFAAVRETILRKALKETGIL